MATSSTRKQSRLARVVDDDEVQHGQLVDCFCERLVDCEHGAGVVAREVSNKRVSRLAVEGGGGAGNNDSKENPDGRDNQEPPVHGRRTGGRGGVVDGRTLPPPHAWLAIEDTKKKHCDPEEQWMRLLRDGGKHHQHLQQPRRSSFSVGRRERAAREAWLDHAWEMKRSWHERNGGAPDADTPVVVVVGGKDPSSSPPASSSQLHAAAVGGGGVAMDVDEVRACRDLGLELPSDCTVEIQCYGLSAAGDSSSPTHTAASSSGADPPCAGVSSPGADPMDVKARLKAWAQAVALTSTTQLGS